MNNDPFTPEELELVKRLKDTPRPELKSATLEEIDRMLRQEVTATFRPARTGLSPVMVITLFLIFLIAVVVGLAALQRNSTSNTATVPGASSTVLPIPSPTRASSATSTSTFTPTAASTNRIAPTSTSITRTFTLSPQRAGWLQTDISLDAGDIFTVGGSGSVNIWPDCEETKAQQGYPNLDCALTTMGPNGTIAFPPAPANYPYPGGLVGALVAKVGDGAPFLVGVGGSFTAQSQGILQFAFNDVVDMQDNQGVFVITVSVSSGVVLSPLPVGWLDLGIIFNTNDVLIISVSGNINLWKGCVEPNPQNLKCADMIVGPAGAITLGAAPVDYPLPGAAVGALIGRIGNGPVFLIGRGGMLIAPNAGSLQVNINAPPDQLQKADGAFRILAQPGVKGDTLRVPAQTYDWIDSGTTLIAGQTFTLTAGSLPANQPPCQVAGAGATTSLPSGCDQGSPSAKASPIAPANYPVPGAALGALIARIGNGTPFLVGNGGKLRADGDGQLQFRLNAISTADGVQNGYVVVVSPSPIVDVPPPASTPLAPPETRGEVVYIPFPVKISLDGKLNDWNGIPMTRVDRGPHPSKNPDEDGAFSFALAADDSNLYVLMLMVDKTIITGRHGSNYWNEDSMEFYLNLSGSLATRTYGSGIYQFIINPGDIGQTDPDGLTVTGIGAQNLHIRGIVFKTRDGWGFEAAVPLAQRPSDRGAIGFQAGANGASSHDRDVKLVWSLTDVSDASHQNPSLFGRGVFFKTQ